MNNDFLNYKFSKENKLIVENTNDHKLEIIADESANLKILEYISWCFKKPYKVKWEQTDRFNVILEEKFTNHNDFSEFSAVQDELKINDVIKELENSNDILDTQEDAPIVKLFNLILKEAISRKASDVHLQVFEDKLYIKMRVHGSFENIFSLKANISSRLFTRVKIISGLDITEKRKPQDGRVTINLGKRKIDLRISTLPSYDSERIVLRLLDQKNQKLQLDDLGMLNNQIKLFEKYLKQKNGIILVTGPTGSGKTTTLYAAIEKIKEKNINIMTIEDPIEYKIDGISQTQVNNKIDLTFANGLRSILRQDPDVILVGEIRDEETADIAVRASMTGHLVLSTLHTNTPLGSFDRLSELGINRKMLTSSVLCVVGQTLEKNYVNEERSGVFEIINMNQNLKDAISKSTEENQLRKKLPKNHISLNESIELKKHNKLIR
tara:strand:+ start:4049 stop:5362 length:1314 start_codon:yes stop_codon:yes gene_type:complete